MNFDLFGGYVKPTEYSKPYRIPYKGSKQVLAKSLVDMLIMRHRNAKYFIDLFGGGGSISFYALHCGFQKVYYNELNNDMCSLIAYLLSKDCEINDYNSRWWKFVTREDFYKIKAWQPETIGDKAYRIAVLICYSFGNNINGYYCPPEKELIKNKLHNLVVYKDYDSIIFIKDYFKSKWNTEDKYLMFWDKFYEMVKDSAVLDTRLRFVNFMLKYEGAAITNCFQYIGDNYLKFLELQQKDIVSIINKNCKDLQIKEYKSANGLQELQQLQQLQRLQRLEQLEQLQQLQQLEQLGGLLSISNYDYKEALSLISKEIDLKDAIIYCDIPYKGTDCKGYASAEFNHEEFYDWCDYYRNQGVDIYISEYNAPFQCVWSRAKRVNIGAVKRDGSKTGGGVERVFINRRLND